MAANRSADQNREGEILEKEIGAEIEEARTLRDLARVEKKETQLLFATVFALLVLIFFVLARDFDPRSFSPGEFLNRLSALELSALAVPAASLIFIFAVYAFLRYRSLQNRRKEVFIQKTKLERAVSNRSDIAALFQISSGVAGHKSLPVILENIARETLGSLKAHRSTVFMLEEKSGTLKSQFTSASDPIHQQVGLFEEKEVARKAVRQKKAFLLRDAGDFAEFLKHEARDRKITSLMSIPLLSNDRPTAVLSVVRIDTDRKFTET
ncbi:MAG TPA: GAF domain-containing protein, partial [Thermodesulfobacteriota bacterium]|nr:GAF domain-containing protein [Thermodesulfobacteriota bacterium]